MSALPRGATARLRKTFQYPTDDSSSSTPEVLDEDEQENLIATLSAENALRNAQFLRAMLALPLLSTIPYVLLVLRRGAPVLLPAVLGLTSLASTAWLLHTQMSTETGFAALDAWARGGSSFPAAAVFTEPGGGSSSSSSRGPQQIRRRRHSSFSLAGRSHTHAHRSPLEAHLPLLNAGLSTVLLLMGVLIATAQGADETGSEHVARAVLACLPAIVYAVVVAAKVMMASVDPERELNGLRYGHKGA